MCSPLDCRVDALLAMTMVGDPGLPHQTLLAMTVVGDPGLPHQTLLFGISKPTESLPDMIITPINYTDDKQGIILSKN
jgi:hypothetical protein